MTAQLASFLPFLAICALFLGIGICVGALLVPHGETEPVEHLTEPLWVPTGEMHAIRAVPTDTVALPRLDVRL